MPEGYTLKKEKKPFYKRLGCLIPLAIVIFIIVVAAFASGGGSNGGSNSADGGENNSASSNEEKKDDGNTLTYILETDGSTVNATYSAQGANISQEQGVQSGWKKEIQFDNKWDAIGANVSGQLDGSGSVTCKILWNGEVVAENTSTGDYSIVTCSPDQSKM